MHCIGFESTTHFRFLKYLHLILINLILLDNMTLANIITCILLDGLNWAIFKLNFLHERLISGSCSRNFTSRLCGLELKIILSNSLVPLCLSYSVINSFGYTATCSFLWCSVYRLLLLLMYTKFLNMALSTNVTGTNMLLINTTCILGIFNLLLLR